MISLKMHPLRQKIKDKRFNHYKKKLWKNYLRYKKIQFSVWNFFIFFSKFKLSLLGLQAGKVKGCNAAKCRNLFLSIHHACLSATFEAYIQNSLLILSEVFIFDNISNKTELNSHVVARRLLTTMIPKKSPNALT